MSSLLVLLALSAAPALPPTGELEFTNLHGGWLRGIHCSSTDPRTAWISGEGGLVRRVEGNGSPWPAIEVTFEETPSQIAANAQLEGIFLIDDGPLAGRGWAVGVDRTVLRRDPVGQRWSLVDEALLPGPDRGQVLTDVFFVEIDVDDDPAGDGVDAALLGWIVGTGGTIWHVREDYSQGQLVEETWTAQQAPLSVDQDCFSVHAVIEPASGPEDDDTLHVYVGADWGHLLHTTDAGRTWTDLEVPGRLDPEAEPAHPANRNFQIHDVVVGSDGTGVASGGCAIRQKVGWVVAIEEFTESSVNHLGARGCPPSVNCDRPGVRLDRGSITFGVCRLPDQRFLCVAYASDTWRSSTTGPDWESTYQPLGNAAHTLTPPLREVGLAGNPAVGHTVYAVGHHGTIRGTDDPLAATIDWEQLTGQFLNRLRAADFLDENTGWLAGQGPTGRVVKTEDGGTTFLPVEFPDGALAIESIDMFDSTRGFAVGSTPRRQAFAARWDGSAWTVVTRALGATEPLWDVHHVDDQRVWVAGSGGFVGYSDDGGASWTSHSIVGTLTGIRFLDTKEPEGYVVGHLGIAGHYSSGEWRRVPVLVDGGAPFRGHLMAMDLDETTGDVVAVGTQGSVFKLVEGQLREVHREPDGRDLVCVALDGDAIYAGGEDGAFLWFDGTTWRSLNPKTSNAVETIAPVPPGPKGRRGFLVSSQSVLTRFEER